ncbi:SMP-30/gluconolactonase/LRE family protein [Diaminobutyricibacter tongyongensis]|uniref:SMP-30/gluconolactonase/LRE family protein n=1 Tax=Leifsonia tongyongensis TaxID=1268043 RepID=A0A6L9XVY7_9MICO|nr:SMP-30/gluconolactonase/LRE family protein [Diaminobutyricibacter tongyongensis]
MTVAASLKTEAFILSEGPTWDPVDGRVTWVDLEAGRILSAPWIDERAALGAVTSVSVGERVGCVFPIGGGRFLAALTRELAIVDAEGVTERSVALTPEGTRFNDGKIDPAGRLLVGTLALDEEGSDHLLLRLEHDGSVTTLDNDLRLSNGLGWSPDGSVFYSIDTPRNTVFRRDYDVASGRVGERSVFIDLMDAHPDGMTVDADGNLWVAIWGGFEVRCYDASGRRVQDATIAVDAPHVSSAAFVGSDLDQLVITSASRDLSPEERLRWPHAGGLFVARSGARGLAPTPWREVPLPA